MLDMDGYVVSAYCACVRKIFGNDKYWIICREPAKCGQRARQGQESKGNDWERESKTYAIIKTIDKSALKSEQSNGN